MICFYSEKLTEAYLSGEINSPHWQAHLGECPDCAAKLREESDFDLILKNALTEDRVDSRHLESEIRASIGRPNPTFPFLGFLRYAAAAVAVLAVLSFATIGYARGRLDRSALCIDAAGDHQQEILNHGQPRWSNDLAKIAEVGQRMTGVANLPSGLLPAAYQLVGARICELHGKEYLHLRYQNGAEELSLYLRRNDAPGSQTARLLNWFRPKGPDAERLDQISVASVQKDGVTLVAVSTEPQQQTLTVAEQAANRL
ncbi:MAG TPA: hypothetical protein VFQ00_10695 [Terriglobales bacterium]|nr:hypothetical protein [Terriglobales bacterium]